MGVSRLYRPVGLFELQLIETSDYQRYPPRLPHQPIFYPVLNYKYAEQIARDWNTNDTASGYMGAVTAFEIDEQHLTSYEERIVGSPIHREIWVPSEELEAFQQHFIGKILVMAVFYGERFSGEKRW